MENLNELQKIQIEYMEDDSLDQGPLGWTAAGIMERKFTAENEKYFPIHSWRKDVSKKMDKAIDNQRGGKHLKEKGIDEL